MGHTRLGKPPTTKKWKAVVATIAGGTTTTSPSAVKPLSIDIETVAREIVDAAAPALSNASRDEGLQYTFFLLTQIALAARSPDWLGQLLGLGLEVRETDSFFDLLSEFQAMIDDVFFDNDLSSDVGEMARQAAGEALASLAADDAHTLFGENQRTVQSAIRPLSTKVGFGKLGQEFFGHFMARFLNFYVSRITAAHVGKERLPQLGDLVTFNKVLRSHCIESAFIVRDFTGAWYSKTEYLQGIDQESTKGFIAVALKKLQAELAQQRNE